MEAGTERGSGKNWQITIQKLAKYDKKLQKRGWLSRS